MRSGTLQAVGPQGSWLPEFVYPAAKDLYQKYRTEVLRKLQDLLVVIVAGGGQLDLTSTVFHTPRIRVLILTTEQGKQRSLQNGVEALPSVEVKALSSAETRISPSAILAFLKQEFDVELLLHEAGPTLFGEFFAGGFVDELFLTVAPQIAGRAADHPRAWPGCECPDLAGNGSLVSASQRKKVRKPPLPALSRGIGEFPRQEEVSSAAWRRRLTKSPAITGKDMPCSAQVYGAEICIVSQSSRMDTAADQAVPLFPLFRP